MTLHNNLKFAQRFVCSHSLWERVGVGETCMAGSNIEVENGRLAR